MAENTLARLFAHGNWANDRIIEVCSALTNEQLDATFDWPSAWSIRYTLLHLVQAQRGYLSLLTLPPEERPSAELSFAELAESARTSGEGLLALARDDGARQEPRVRTTDGYVVEPWVVMVQAINHATDHRRQISDLLRVQGMTPPKLDGWSFGESEDALIPTSKTTIKAHERSFDEAPRVRAGDRVRVVRHDEESVGWFLGAATGQPEGYYPLRWFDLGSDGSVATAKRDYDAAELTIAAGVEVEWLATEEGWVLVRTAEGNRGWIPCSCVE